MEFITAAEAVKVIKSGDRVFLHGGASTPVLLIKAMQQRHAELRNVELVSITNLGDVEFDNEDFRESFFINALFVSANTRTVANSENGDYVPIFLSQIPQLFRKKIMPLNVALIHVSPPDAHGYCSLGPSVDVAKAAIESAAIVIAQVNKKVPRTHGQSFVHTSCINLFVRADSDLPEVNYSNEDCEITSAIGRNVASLIEDGATLQMGIGSIPDQVLKNLMGHKDLGLHTEMFSDGVIPLLEKGIINNSRKCINLGKSVTGFIVGTRKLYDFVDDNPGIRVMDIAYVNDTSIIRKNPKVTAINSAIEIDLTGQVCADSIGTYQYSGIGGQMDFMRGASLSEDGKPIIAMPSITSKGKSRIVPFLKEGAGVVTTRGHVHWVVTEHGMVNLFGQNLKQRGKLLISIADPIHREWLDKAFHARFK